jgi:hypothetical protein
MLKTPTSEEMRLLDKSPMPFGAFGWFIQMFTDRIAVRWRRFIQISALSTFDGKVLAYHSFNG